MISAGRQGLHDALQRQLGLRGVVVGRRTAPDGRESWLVSDRVGGAVQFLVKPVQNLWRGGVALEAQQRAAPRRGVWFDSSAKLLIREWIEGESLDRVSPRTLIEYLPAAGRALSAIHAASPPQWPVQSWNDRWQARAGGVPLLCAAVSAECVTWIERALARAAALDARHPMRTRPTLLHGDFHLRQLIVTPTGLEVIDWDDACCGEREFDVAYFLAYLRSHCDAAEAEHAGRQFLGAYRSCEPLDVARLSLWKGYNLLRRALRRQTLKDPGYERERDRMLGLLPDWLEESRVFAG